MFDTRNGEEERPYAFDPLVEPEYFRGVLSRRFMAFLIDTVIICAPVGVAALLIFVFGFLTLGLGWFLFSLLGPGYVVWALVYVGLTLGGPRSATLGMRAMGIEMRVWHGAPMSPMLAVVSLVLFWVSVSVFTPFVTVIGLLNRRKRLAHDFIIGTVVTNNDERAGELRGYR
ncbi:putative RDD family membrane protein YckC [Ancylobacter aquaticus]|uniref:Putative RDD family membrane protein YckC n=1 Tax=Ancylobacter aquaticus TaxID=100 RepID=A0A4R1ICD8_ANCAQ|nr:RDD family protein [Ancylobacter aquaticus]TCK28222.1 putative RDD family membrane protein YckC [Ancylobacter aquaticus]